MKNRICFLALFVFTFSCAACSIEPVKDLEPTIKAAPTLIDNFAYDGQFHNAIIPGEVTGGSFYYQMDEGEWKIDIPEIKDVGVYSFSYKVIGEKGYKNLDPVSLGSVTVSCGIPVITTAPVLKQDAEYTGNPIELVTPGAVTNGTFEYKINSGEFSSNIPSATESGTYSISYRVKGDEHYSDIDEVLLGDVTIYNTYKLTFASNNEEYGTVNIPSIEKVREGTQIIVSGNNLIIGETTIIPTPAQGSREYYYKFVSWSSLPETVTSDLDVVATFEKCEQQTFTITYKLENGEPDIVETHYFGDVLIPPNPVKFDRSLRYDLLEWDPAIKTVSENAVYTALYKNSPVYDTEGYRSDLYVTDFASLSEESTELQIAQATPFFRGNGTFEDGFKIVKKGNEKALKLVAKGNGDAIAGYGGTINPLSNIVAGEYYDVSFDFATNLTDSTNTYFQIDYMVPPGANWNGIEIHGDSINCHSKAVVFNPKYENGKVSYTFLAESTDVNVFNLYLVNASTNDEVIISNFKIRKTNLVYFDDFSSYSVGTTMTNINHFYNDEGISTASIINRDGHNVLNIGSNNVDTIWPKFYFNNLNVLRNTTYTFHITFGDYNTNKICVGGPWTSWQQGIGPQLRFIPANEIPYDGYEIPGDNRMDGGLNYFNDKINLEFNYTVPSEATYAGGDFAQIEFILTCPANASVDIVSIEIYRL